MIHIEGMGILGSFLAWELHNRAIPFRWTDNNSKVNAWQACTGAIYPAGKYEEDRNYRIWLERFTTNDYPWQELGHSFTELTAYCFVTKKPPHGGKYGVFNLCGPVNVGSMPSIHFNAQVFVQATRSFFASVSVDHHELGDQRIVAHGFSWRTSEYVWGWTVPVKLTPALVRQRQASGSFLEQRPCLYLRKGSFFQYAYPCPGTSTWYAGSSLIVQKNPHNLNVPEKIDTWRHWLEKFTEGHFKAEIVGDYVQGWRPRGAENDPEVVKDGYGTLFVKPHWHDGVRNSPSIMKALLLAAGIEH